MIGHRIFAGIRNAAQVAIFATLLAGCLSDEEAEDQVLTRLAQEKVNFPTTLLIPISDVKIVFSNYIAKNNFF